MKFTPLTGPTRERVVLIIGAITAVFFLCSPPWYAIDGAGHHIHAGHHGINLWIVWPDRRISQNLDADIDLPLLAIEEFVVGFVTLCLARAVR